MTKTDAKEFGRIAFEEGRGPFPFADPAMSGLLAGEVGGKTALLKAWSNGWQAANLAAPID